MNCIRCNGDTKVIDSRDRAGNVKYRRRECLSCGYRYTTYERAEADIIQEDAEQNGVCHEVIK